MTYGENVTDLRVVMTSLLNRHRVLQPLGGPGIYTVPESTTVEERIAMGEEIQRFRHVVLSWCADAIDTVAPSFLVGVIDGKRNQPVTALRDRLAETNAAITFDYPAMESLATPHANNLVETWRQAAKACVLAEIDLGPSAHQLGLDDRRARVVLEDAAGFIRGLVVLDGRYGNVPGWEHFTRPGRLEAAAEVAIAFARCSEQDPGVDRHGWRPPPSAIKGPALPGLAGVVQAQHNALVDLGAHAPTAMNLRRIFRSQIQVAHEAARHAAHGAPELVEPLLEREQTYRQLHVAARNLGGQVGDGGPAAAESANAADRLRHAPMASTDDAPTLHELARLFAGTDARLAATIEQGFADKRYFVSIKSRDLSDAIDLAHARTRRWVPVISSAQTELLPIARWHLRPPPTPAPSAVESHSSRDEFAMTLATQPTVRRSIGRGR